MNSALFVYHLSSRTKKSKRQFLVAEIAIVVEILMDSINKSHSRSTILALLLVKIQQNIPIALERSATELYRRIFADVIVCIFAH